MKSNTLYVKKFKTKIRNGSVLTLLSVLTAWDPF